MKYSSRYYRIAAGFEKPKNVLDRIAFRAWSSLGISPSKLQRCIWDEYERQLNKRLQKATEALSDLERARKGTD